MAIRNTLLGMIRATTGHTADIAPPPAQARMIVGGDAARELCMLPVDCKPDTPPAGTRIVQVKADGIRAIYTGGRIVTREGVPLNCALHCQPGLRRLEEAFGCEMMFDGEYVEDNGFNATIAAFRKGSGNGVFWIFDAVPNGAWVAGGSDRPIEERLAGIGKHLDASDSCFIGSLAGKLLDEEGTRGFCAELWALGYEGVVSKALGSPYIRDRSDHWQRIKRVFTEDLAVMDVLCEGGILRKIMVRGPTGPITVTSGWNGGHGGEIVGAFARWKAGDPPLLAEISYQLTTGVKRSIRGAVFHRLRTDKRAKA